MKKFLTGSMILIIGDLLTKVISILYLVPLKLIDQNIVLLMTNLLIPFGFFIVLTTLGINVIFTSELVEAKTAKKTKEVLVDVAIIVTTLTTLGVILMTGLSPYIMSAIELNQEYVKTLVYGSYMLNLGIILFAISSYLRSFFMAYGEYKIISITYITEQLIRVGIILLLSYNMFYLNDKDIKYSVFVIVVAIIVSQMSTLLIFINKLKTAKYYEKFKGSYVFKTKNFKYLIFTSFVFFMSGLYITLFDQIDILLLSKQMIDKGFDITFINNIKVEYFTLSFKIVMVPISISTAFISVMIKYLGDQEKNKKKEFKKVLGLTILYSLFMMIAIAILGPFVYKVLYQEPSSGIIRIQSLIIPCYILKNVISGYILTNKGSKKSIVVSTFIIIFLKISLDFILFNSLLYYGYIWATIIALLAGSIYLIKSNKNMFI